MDRKTRSAAGVALAGIWIAACEFLRNEVLLKSVWTEHYRGLGLEFPGALVNGAVWGLWSFLFAGFIFLLSRRFGFVATTVLAWFSGFLLMWIVIGNLGVLPLGILPYAVPWSILETGVAALVVARLSPVD